MNDFFIDGRMSARTRIKVCGLTRIEDVRVAVAAGVDAIGLVFYPPSKRALDPPRARGLRLAVPAFVDVVSLFVNATRAEVEEVVAVVRPDLLQFHGEESPEFCASFGLRYMKGFRVGAPGLDTPAALADHCSAFHEASAWLFDSYSGGYGGSGTAFDTGLLRELQAREDVRPLVLAGGLSADNVGVALSAVGPYAVDVSSGVEDAPGLKNAGRIRAFVDAVHAADRARVRG